MSFHKNVWNQLKGICIEDLIRALEKDGWKLDECAGAIRVYLKDGSGRVSIHYHPKKTFGAGLLKGLLSDIGWSEADLKRLKLVK